jgi:hypothetical protein
LLERPSINEQKYIITACAANSNVALRKNWRQAGGTRRCQRFFWAGSGMAPVHLSGRRGAAIDFDSLSLRPRSFCHGQLPTSNATLQQQFLQ